MSLRNLGQRERRLFELYTRCRLEMHPQLFYSKWNVTHAELAQICRCSVPTVNRWFAGGKNHRSPDPTHLRRLAEMDFLWEHYELIPSALRRLICSNGGERREDLSP